MALRSDVVGSLLRPPDLLEARAAVESGRLSAREFKRIEDRAVDEAVRLQEAAGPHGVTRGGMGGSAGFGPNVGGPAGVGQPGGGGPPRCAAEGGARIFS